MFLQMICDMAPICMSVKYLEMRCIGAVIFTGGSAGGLFCGSISTIVSSSYSEREKQWVGFRQLVPAIKFFKDGKDLSIGN